MHISCGNVLLIKLYFRRNGYALLPRLARLLTSLSLPKPTVSGCFSFVIRRGRNGHVLCYFFALFHRFLSLSSAYDIFLRGAACSWFSPLPQAGRAFCFFFSCLSIYLGSQSDRGRHRENVPKDQQVSRGLPKAGSSWHVSQWVLGKIDFWVVCTTWRRKAEHFQLYWSQCRTRTVKKL